MLKHTISLSDQLVMTIKLTEMKHGSCFIISIKEPLIDCLQTQKPEMLQKVPLNNWTGHESDGFVDCFWIPKQLLLQN